MNTSAAEIDDSDSSSSDNGDDEPHASGGSIIHGPDYFRNVWITDRHGFFARDDVNPTKIVVDVQLQQR